MSAPTLERAISLAYRYIGPRERTVHEVREHLTARVDDPGLVEAAVAELCELGYLDDERYARLFVEDKLNLEGWGAERIREGLRSRGVDRELVARAVAGSAEGEHERALSLLRRRFPDPPRDRRERERAFGVLVRKGYASEVALDALNAWSSDRAEA